MEPIEIVPKSFGCFSPKGLKLRLNSFGRSSKNSLSNLSSPSPRSPKSPNVTTHFAPKATKQDVMQQVYRRFDGNNDGKISALELRSYFASIGDYMSHEEAQVVIDENDTDGDNLIDFQDFTRLVRTKGQGQGQGEVDEDIRAAFETFEMEKGCGRITPTSLQRVLSKLGDLKSYDECVSMIQVFDRDGNGELDFHEFHQMMMA